MLCCFGKARGPSGDASRPAAHSRARPACEDEDVDGGLGAGAAWSLEKPNADPRLGAAGAAGTDVRVAPLASGRGQQSDVLGGALAQRGPAGSGAQSSTPASFLLWQFLRDSAGGEPDGAWDSASFGEWALRRGGGGASARRRAPRLEHAKGLQTDSTAPASRSTAAGRVSRGGGAAGPASPDGKTAERVWCEAQLSAPAAPMERRLTPCAQVVGRRGTP